MKTTFISQCASSLCLLVASLTMAAHGQGGADKSGEDLLTVIVETTTALSGVTDAESAKTVAPALEKWRQSMFQSDDPAVMETLRLRIENDGELAKELAMFGAQMQRISNLGPEVFAIVAEGLSGSRPLDVRLHFEEIAKSLKTVTDMATAESAQADLEKWGRPIFDLVDQDGEQFMDYVDQNEAIRLAYEAYLQEAERIRGLDEAVAEKVTLAMMSEEVHQRIVKRAEEAMLKVPLLKTRSSALQLKVALASYFTEYRRHPWASDDKLDLVRGTDAEFHKVLSGDDDKLNPRRVTFLQVSEEELAEDGSVIDSWGKQFRVFLDTDYDMKILLPPEYGDGVQIRASVAIDSAGPDGDFGTVADNITTWQDLAE